jgi:hypothetical protein
MKSETKQDAWKFYMRAFADWLGRQPQDAQGAIVQAARAHGWQDTTETWLLYLYSNAGKKGFPSEQGVGEFLRLIEQAMRDVDAIPLRHERNAPYGGRGGQVADKITAEETARLLGISRAALFLRLNNDPDMRARLGFAGTNTRNGRYSLRAVLAEVSRQKG